MINLISKAKQFFTGVERINNQQLKHCSMKLTQSRKVSSNNFQINSPTTQCYKDETDSKYTVKNPRKKIRSPPVGIEPNMNC